MIFHASIAADEPQRVASVIAELWGGEAMPFPPYPESFIAISGAPGGAEVEVCPRWLEQKPGEVEVEPARNDQASSFSPVHLAVSTKLSEAQVMAIGEREGWLARRCNRGGVFDVIELWLENKFMVEVLTDEMQQQYLAFMTPAGFRRVFAEQPAGQG